MANSSDTPHYEQDMPFEVPEGVGMGNDRQTLFVSFSGKISEVFRGKEIPCICPEM